MHTVEVGGIYLYYYDNENKSKSKVQVVRILDNPRGVAEVKFLEVYEDDSGNGYFTYLQKTGFTMNVSIKYLHPVEE